MEDVGASDPIEAKEMMSNANPTMTEKTIAIINKVDTTSFSFVPAFLNIQISSKSLLIKLKIYAFTLIPSDSALALI